MAIKMKVDSIDGLKPLDPSEVYRKVEKDGKTFYVVDGESVDGWAAEDLTAFKAAHEEVTDGRRKAKARVSELEAELKAAKDAVEQFQAADKDKPNVEEKAKKLAEQQIKELTDKLTAEKASLQSKLESEVQLGDKLAIEQTLAAAYDGLELIEGGRQLIGLAAREQLFIERDEDGTRHVRVKSETDPKRAAISKLPENNGSMAASELIQSLVKKAPYNHLVKGSGMEGTGTPTNVATSDGAGGGASASKDPGVRGAARFAAAREAQGGAA